MILVTGAAGKTGQAVLSALASKGAQTRALIRRAASKQSDAIVGDMADPLTIAKALQGADAVYLIVPNLHPQEFEIGRAWITAARSAGIKRFVYHSVLFPQIEAMPHHWQKLQVEEALIQSGLDFTILQPASYMQNIRPYWQEIVSKGLYRMPYSVQSRFSPVDLKDVAEVSTIVLQENGHSGGIYQLAGPEVLNSAEMAVRMGKELGHAVQAASQPLLEWMISAKNLSQYARDSLGQMFAYYDQHGFWSSNQTLENLMGRPQTSFATFLQELSK
jgi:uncharacterized protein YbjT (DUF2867 family)